MTWDYCLYYFSNSTTTTYLRINTNSSSLRVCRRLRHHQSLMQVVLTWPEIENTAALRLSYTKSLSTASKCQEWGDIMTLSSVICLRSVPIPKIAEVKHVPKYEDLHPTRKETLLIAKVTWKISCVTFLLPDCLCQMFSTYVVSACARSSLPFRSKPIRICKFKFGTSNTCVLYKAHVFVCQASGLGWLGLHRI